jgi:acyl transferase domain-containing protein
MSTNEDIQAPSSELEIAIIGLACRFPGAGSAEAFWQNLRAGVESITFLRDDEIEPSSIDPGSLDDPNYVKAAAVLDDVEWFDAAFFGITPKEAEVMDPQQRVFLECAWEALEHAGYDSERYRGAIGVYGGARTNTYIFNLYSNPAAVGSLNAFEVGLGNDLAFLSTQASYKLNLRGPACAVHTACSTALVAVHMACKALLADECQMALAGGVAVNVPHKTGYLYQHGGITSPDGHCRPFDARAQGTIFGSGVGLVVLKRLEDALADGDTIHAVIKGSAINNDGRSKASFTAPSVQGQARVIAEALAVADVEPETVSYVETHGTGTAIGDPIEIRALTRVFQAATDARGFCAIGSVKSNVGHLDAAAGSASLIKTVLALRHRELPPSLHFEQPNPQIDFAETPFYVNTALKPWPAGPTPRRAGVSAFGVGGTNAHLVLEEPPPAPETERRRPWELLVLSAKTPGALETLSANLAAHLRRHPEQRLADIAHTLRVGRREFPHRRALAARDAEEAARLLEMSEPQRVWSGVQEISRRPVAFLFPGGGAQYAGMAAELYQTEPVFRAEIDRCAELLRPHLDTDLREVLYPSDERRTTNDERRTTNDERRTTNDEGANHVDRTPDVSTGDLRPSSFVLGQAEGQLEQPRYALPALFAVEYALARLLIAWGVKPAAAIGHSLGEYVAACLAGVFSLADALALVALRGRLFEQIDPGAMLSVSLPEHEVADLLGDRLSIAAINGPGQCVVAGPAAEIGRLAEALAERQVELRRLHINVAAHSTLVEPILPEFTAFVRRIALSAPTLPFVSNVTGTWITPEQATDPLYWARHLRQTVRFGAGVACLLQEPTWMLLEVGPGQSLSTLAKLQADPAGAKAVLTAMRHPRDPQPDSACLLAALGKLWLAGVQVDWDQMVADAPCRRVPLPTYPFERQRYWIDPGAGTRALAADAAPAGKQRDIASWFYQPAWRSSLPRAASEEALAQRRGWLILTDTCGVAEGLAQRLEQAGHEVVRAAAGAGFAGGGRRYTLDPERPEDYTRLLRELEGQGLRPDSVVHAWSLGETQAGDAGPEQFRQAQRLGYYSLLFLGQALVGVWPDRPLRLEVISNNIHRVDEHERTLPEKATMLGPCKVIPQEHQSIACRCIDIRIGRTAGAGLTEQLLSELTSPSADMVVAYRGSRRWAQTFAPLPLAQDSLALRPLRQDGVYLITGGLGGVGLLLAEHLARSVRARLVLVGRTPLPERAAWDAWLAEHAEDDRISGQIRQLRGLESLGVEVLTLAADVADAQQMRAVLEQIDRRFGRLDGVLHAAGVTSGPSLYRPLTEIGPAESDTQFQPKVYGTYALAQALEGRALDFVLLFSSNAAVLGGLGYLTYAAANLFLDAFAAAHSQATGTTWASATWDAWPGETKRYQGFQTSMDQYTMTAAEAAEAFERIVTRAIDGHVVVATGDLPYRLGLWIHRTAAPSAPQGAGHQRASARSAYVAPGNEVEQAVAEIWQRLLGIEQVGAHDNFFDLGGHSLLATRLIAQMRDRFQMDIQLGQFFESPTVAGMARVVLALQAEQEQDEDSELLDLVSSLSDEEVHAALAQRGGALG